MNAVVSPVSSGEHANRFSVALLFSLLLHAIVILGIGFHLAKPAPSTPTLDITLINTSNGETPKKADYLAQVNNAGGGTRNKAHLPGGPFTGPLPISNPGIAPVAVLPAAPKAEAASGPHVLITRSATKRRVVQQHDQRAEPQSTQQVVAIPAKQRLEMARLTQEVRKEEEAYAHRPRRKYISANTKSIADAAYQVAWVHRIERVGNLNYPTAARRRHLHGELVLSVAIGVHGHVHGVTIDHSSGYPVLDDAAVRIVHLAAPFPPIPNEKDTRGHRIDELVITRTWQFLPGNRLKTESVSSQ